MAFISDIKQFPIPAAFAAYLRTLPPPNWPGDNPIGSTVHNTYRPLPSEWRGRSSMLGMVTTYKAKGWDRGPHFYLALGSPNAAHNGIWQMTPPTIPGIHAGACNEHRFGVEVVGDFEATHPTAAQQALLVDTLAALHAWAGIGPNLAAHRDCMAGRTCPGTHMYTLMPALRTQLATRLAPPAPPPAVAYRVIAPMWVSETTSPHGPIALDGQGFVWTDDVVMIDEARADGWYHLANGEGFLPAGGLEKML